MEQQRQCKNPECEADFPYIQRTPSERYKFCPSCRWMMKRTFKRTLAVASAISALLIAAIQVAQHFWK